MGMTQNVPQIAKVMTIKLYDERLNLFVSPEDMAGHMEVLSAIIRQFAMLQPIVGYLLNWPPDDILLDNLSTWSPIRQLYSALFELLSDSGYPATVIPTIKVIQHAPRETTILEVAAHLRIRTVH